MVFSFRDSRNFPGHVLLLTFPDLDMFLGITCMNKVFLSPTTDRDKELKRSRWRIACAVASATCRDVYGPLSRVAVRSRYRDRDLRQKVSLVLAR